MPTKAVDEAKRCLIDGLASYSLARPFTEAESSTYQAARFSRRFSSGLKSSARGRKLSQPSDERYRGGPEKPFTRAELHEKFTDCASLVLSGDQIKRALDAIESVDRLASVRESVVAPGEVSGQDVETHGRQPPHTSLRRLGGDGRRRRELNILRDVAAALGRSAVSAAHDGFYVTTDRQQVAGEKVSWAVP